MERKVTVELLTDEDCDACSGEGTEDRYGTEVRYPCERCEGTGKEPCHRCEKPAHSFPAAYLVNDHSTCAECLTEAVEEALAPPSAPAAAHSPVMEAHDRLCAHQRELAALSVLHDTVRPGPDPDEDPFARIKATDKHIRAEAHDDSPAARRRREATDRRATLPERPKARVAS